MIETAPSSNVMPRGINFPLMYPLPSASSDLVSIPVHHALTNMHNPQPMLFSPQHRNTAPKNTHFGTIYDGGHLTVSQDQHLIDQRSIPDEYKVCIATNQIVQQQHEHSHQLHQENHLQYQQHHHSDSVPLMNPPLVPTAYPIGDGDYHPDPASPPRSETPPRSEAEMTPEMEQAYDAFQLQLLQQQQHELVQQQQQQHPQGVRSLMASWKVGADGTASEREVAATTAAAAAAEAANEEAEAYSLWLADLQQAQVPLPLGVIAAAGAACGRQMATPRPQLKPTVDHAGHAEDPQTASTEHRPHPPHHQPHHHHQDPAIVCAYREQGQAKSSPRFVASVLHGCIAYGTAASARSHAHAHSLPRVQ
jgi:hypothetical protein